MIQYSIIVTLIAVTAIVIVLFFLPALVELKRPVDAGPRLINANTPKIREGSLKVSLMDIEEQQNFSHQLNAPVLGSLYALEDLEFSF